MDAVTLAMINALGGGGSGSLPAVTSADNGSELIVKNGAWTKQKKKFVVTLTPTSPDYSGTMDKTVAEINAAYEAGQEIWFKVAASGFDVLIPMSDCSVSSDFTYPSFDCRMVDITTNVEVCVRTSVTDDGTKQTYSTTIYSLTPAS